MNTISPLLFLFSSLTAVSIANPKDIQLPNSRPSKNVKEFVGRIETGMMAIDGETTGTQLVLDDNSKFEIQVPASIDISQYPGRVKIKGRMKNVKSVERGMRQVIQVISVEAVAQ